MARTPLLRALRQLAAHGSVTVWLQEAPQKSARLWLGSAAFVQSPRAYARPARSLPT